MRAACEASRSLAAMSTSSRRVGADADGGGRRAGDRSLPLAATTRSPRPHPEVTAPCTSAPSVSFRFLVSVEIAPEQRERCGARLVRAVPNLRVQTCGHVTHIERISYLER
ncbi:hypothetical protein nbrc107696_08180 [Gordonia spumicola]|uniref:Uncharacterized protein n=1 Tax=Gordonia spumicola TaxID=589161 RepID=A0A7I9V5B4_9ACTN|nr:hypothetical protein nbrc107696_08180 [Gordonia spumicola]